VKKDQDDLLMEKINDQEPEDIRQYSIISLILGIACAVLPIIFFVISNKWLNWKGVFNFFVYLGGPGWISGIILGIKGENTYRRKLAIIGITICTTCLIIWIPVIIWFTINQLWASLR
jgi:hypothetical protein